MNIKLTAQRTVGKSTDVSISFSEIKNDGFALVSSRRIENSRGEEGVVFHIKNTALTTIDQAGTEKISFNCNLEFETDTIRVFYWNDEGSLTDNLQCFIDFLETNRLNQVAVREFYCSSTIKSKSIPRQAGNGGVIGITR